MTDHGDGWAGLDAALLAAHGDDDRPRLVALYARAGDLAEAEGQIDRACFYLTHAWIFALEQGLDASAALQSRLAARGRMG